MDLTKRLGRMEMEPLSLGIGCSRSIVYGSYWQEGFFKDPVKLFFNLKFQQLGFQGSIIRDWIRKEPIPWEN